MPTPRLVIIRGLPGSGKTTMAKAMVGFDHFEADQWFERTGEYKFTASELQLAHQHCFSSTASALKSGRNVVVSNTFTKKWEMQQYINLARDMGVVPEIIEATGTWNNVHGVPSSVVDNMRARWEPLTETDNRINNPEHGDRGPKCHCSGYKTWCATCSVWSRTCCQEYGSCQCS